MARIMSCVWESAIMCTLVQSWIVCGDTRRAGILVALQCLDTAQCKHKTACRNAKIGTHAKRPGDFSRMHQLAGGADLDLIAQPRAAQCVVDETQPLHQRRLARAVPIAAALVDNRRPGGDDGRRFAPD